MTARKQSPATMPTSHDDIRPGQSVELLKELHILTRDGRMNQDSRRKLKQVYHLYRFIEPLLEEVRQVHADIRLVDHGAGKSYLGFILHDLYFKALTGDAHIYGIETRDELVERSRELAERLGFAGMSFLNLSVAESIDSGLLPERVDVVTALHACNTATDDAIRFALRRQARFIVLVPCCQAEVAAVLRKNKGRALANPLSELWRHPIHTREFGSHVDQCAALPPAPVPRLRGERHRTGGLGALDEERADRRPLQRPAATYARRATEGVATQPRPGRTRPALLYRPVALCHPPHRLQSITCDSDI